MQLSKSMNKTKTSPGFHLQSTNSQIFKDEPIFKIQN